MVFPPKKAPRSRPGGCGVLALVQAEPCWRTDTQNCCGSCFACSSWSCPSLPVQLSPALSPALSSAAMQHFSALSPAPFLCTFPLQPLDAAAAAGTEMQQEHFCISAALLSLLLPRQGSAQGSSCSHNSPPHQKCNTGSTKGFSAPLDAFPSKHSRAARPGRGSALQGSRRGSG